MNYLRRKHNLVVRRITTYTEGESEDKVEKIKFNFISRVKKVLKDQKIPFRNLLNLDETRLVLGGMDNSTIDFKGAKSVKVKCKEPKKAITVTLAARSNGEVLNPFTIFKGNVICL